MLDIEIRSCARVLCSTASLAALAACLSIPAFAQSTTDMSPQGIQDIIVTARKRAETSQTVPLAITAVSSEELKVRTVNQISDVKALVPGISMQNDSYTNFGVRFGIRGQQSTDSLLQSQNSVGIYMDGVYVANSAGLLMANLGDVQQMDVLKGPQGTLFGRNTTGGAIVITTREPEYEISNELKFGAGRFGRLELSNTLNLPIVDGKAALRLTGQYFNNDGFGRRYVGTGNERGAGPRDISDQQNFSFRGALRLDPTEQLNIILRADYSRGESHGRLERLVFANPAGASALATLVQLGLWNAPSATAPSGTPNIAALTSAGLTPATAFPYAANLLLAQQPNDRYGAVGNIYVPSHIREYGFSGTVSYDLSDVVTLKSISAYRHMNYFAGQDTDNTNFALLDTAIEIQRLNVFSQELTLNGSSFENFVEWTLGGYYFRQRGEDIQTFQALSFINPFATLTNGRYTQKSMAAYGQATFNLTDAFRVTAGLRYTSERQDLLNRSGRLLVPTGTVLCDEGSLPDCRGDHQQKANNLSYLLSADYRFTPDVMVYARTARGFKGGGTNLRGGLLVGAPFRPEEVTDYEIGLKSYLLDRRVRLNIAAFQSDYKDIQRVVVVPAAGGTPTSIINNAAAARIRGVEVDLLVQPVDGLAISFSGSHLDTRYKSYISTGSNGLPADLSGNSFQAVPKWAWSASANYAIPVGDDVLRPSIDYSYQSSVNFQSDNNTVSLNSAQYTTQRGYGLLGARIAYELDGGDTSVALWAKNLTGKYYIAGALDVAQSVGLITNTIGAPRTWGVQLSKKF